MDIRRFRKTVFIIREQLKRRLRNEDDEDTGLISEVSVLADDEDNNSGETAITDDDAKTAILVEG